MSTLINPATLTRTNFLTRLGVHGWEEVCRYLMASVLTGSPICMYGEHGAAKTMTFRLVAEKLLGQEYCLYDASKANMVDIIGYPNMEKFKQGSVEYVRTKMSIWDKKIIILDEVTRAREDIQNQYLEVLRNSTIQGVFTGAIWKFCAANTLEYAGTRPLDAAFASRIGYYVPVPTITKMQDADRHSVIKNMENSDGRALRFWNPSLEQPEDNIPNMVDEFFSWMEEVNVYYMNTKETYDDMITEYVDKFSMLLNTRTKQSVQDNKGEHVSLDGRTQGTLRSNIIANLALEAFEYDKLGIEFTNEHFRDMVQRTVHVSFPWVLTGTKVESNKVAEAHNQAQRCLETRNMLAYVLATEMNPVKKVMMSLLLEDYEPVAIFEATEHLFNTEELDREACVFSMLMRTRPQLLKKYTDKAELHTQIVDKYIAVYSSVMKMDVPEDSPYSQILKEKFGIDTSKESLVSTNAVEEMVQASFSYINYKHQKNGGVLKMDLISYSTEVDQMVSLFKSLKEVMDHDYSSTVKKLTGKK